MSIELVASGSAVDGGLNLLKQAAESCVANGGDWYTSDQALGILQYHVDMPALLADATFIGMCTPERVLELFDMARDAHLFRLMFPDEAGRELARKTLEAVKS